MGWIDALSETLLAFADSPWALLVLLVACILDGVAPIVPAEAFLLGLAALAASGGGPQLGAVIGVAALGALLGDLLAVAIGRLVPLHRLPLLRGGAGLAHVDSVRSRLARHGASVIIAGRFVPLGRVAVTFTAGALRYPVRRFVLFDSVAVTAWAAYQAALGALAGAALGERPLLAVGVGMVAGVLVAGVVGQLGALARRVSEGRGPVRGGATGSGRPERRAGAGPETILIAPGCDAYRRPSRPAGVLPSGADVISWAGGKDGAAWRS